MGHPTPKDWPKLKAGAIAAGKLLWKVGEAVAGKLSKGAADHGIHIIDHAIAPGAEHLESHLAPVVPRNWTKFLTQEAKTLQQAAGEVMK